MKTLKTALLSGVMFLTGCSANWHLQRAISKGAKVTSDTIYRTDSLVIDTTVKITMPARKLENTYLIRWGERGLMPLSSSGDNGVSVRVDVVNDTLFVEANCDSASQELHFYKALYAQCATAVSTKIECDCFAKTWRDVIVYVLAALGVGMLVILILKK